MYIFTLFVHCGYFKETAAQRFRLELLNLYANAQYKHTQKLIMK